MPQVYKHAHLYWTHHDQPQTYVWDSFTTTQKWSAVFEAKAAKPLAPQGILRLKPSK